MTLGQNKVLRYGHLSDFWSIFRDRMANFCPNFQNHPLLRRFGLTSGVEEDAELKWGHLKFLALTHPPPLKIYIVFCS